MATAHSTVRYRISKKFPGYKIGDDGSLWTKWPVGRWPANGEMNSYWRRLKLKPGANGYVQVRIRSSNGWKLIYLHRLVLEAFVGPCPVGMECCHKDDDRSNNRLDNLRWDTRKGNHSDRLKHGTYGNKLNEAQVHEILNSPRGRFVASSLAEKYGVTSAMIRMIWRGASWSKVPGKRTAKKTYRKINWGGEYITQAECARRLNVPQGVVRDRVRLGWKDKDIVAIPYHPHKRGRRNG